MRTGARRGVLLPAALAAGPFLLLALRILVDRGDPLLSGDHALIDLAVRDLPGRALGVYSRYGFFHPGPALFWGLGPAMWLTGGATWALPLGAQLLQAAVLAALVWVAARREGPAAAWAVAAAALTYVLCLRIGLLHVPWNPLQAALPVALVLVAAAATETLGPAAALAALAGTVAVHGHAGTAPAVAAGGLLTAVWALRGWRRERRVEAPLVTATLVAVTVLVWLPPLAEQLMEEPGNLGRLARFALDGTGEDVGWADGLPIAGRELAVVPFGIQSRGALVAPEFDAAAGVAGLVAFTAAVAGLWWTAGRTRQLFARRLAVAAAAGGVAALVGAAAIDGVPYWYLGVWMTAPAVPLLAGWALVLAGAAPRGREALAGATAVVAVLALIAAGRLTLHDDYAFPNEPANRREVRALTPLVIDAAQGHDRVVLDATAEELVHRLAAVAIQLETRGIGARVTPRFEPYFGPDRVAAAAGTTPLVTVARRGETAPGRLVGTAGELAVWRAQPAFPGRPGGSLPRRRASLTHRWAVVTGTPLASARSATGLLEERARD